MEVNFHFLNWMERRIRPREKSPLMTGKLNVDVSVNNETDVCMNTAGNSKNIEDHPEIKMIIIYSLSCHFQTTHDLLSSVEHNIIYLKFKCLKKLYFCTYTMIQYCSHPILTSKISTLMFHKRKKVMEWDENKWWQINFCLKYILYEQVELKTNLSAICKKWPTSQEDIHLQSVNYSFL